jgi:hypothetical protein
MYRGFKLALDTTSNEIFRDLQLERGRIIFEGYRKLVSKQLNQYINSSNYLDGNGIQKAWFPQVKADIFISHSHNDEQLAYKLAGWLDQNFGLKAFIDTAVWGYGDDLLKEMDELYCRKSNGNYDYADRNRSTAHVHMMLASAITSMIDQCECLFFLNTPSALRFAEGKEITKSAWLYYEIGQSQMIRIQKPVRALREHYRTFSERGELKKALNFQVEYDLDTSHLSDIKTRELSRWLRLRQQNQDINPLDLLYQISLNTDVTF